MKQVFHSSTPKAAFTWIDVANPSNEELEALAIEYKLHPTAVQDCLQPNHLPKYELLAEMNFIITRVYEPEPGLKLSVQQLTHKLAIFFNDEIIITIHRRPKPFLEKIKSTFVDAEKCRNSFHLLCKIMKAVLVSFDEPAEGLQKEVDFYEESLITRTKTPIFPKGLYHIKQKSNLIKRLLHFTMAIFEELEDSYPADPYLRDLKENQQRLIVTYDNLLENATSLLNFYVSLSSSRTNEVMRILTIFSAFFMPLTFIVGIYGMNFEHIPELQYAMGYPITIGFMLIVTLVIFQWFKRKAWL